MADSDHRTRMISIRLSNAEYEALRSQYKTYGARSASDLARMSLRWMLNGCQASQDKLAATLADHDSLIQDHGKRINGLESKISLILEREGVTS